MYSSKISGVGHYVPENVVTNDDLSKVMETNDAWIQERTGIKERRHIKMVMATTPLLWEQRPLELQCSALELPPKT